METMKQAEVVDTLDVIPETNSPSTMQLNPRKPSTPVKTAPVITAPDGPGPTTTTTTPVTGYKVGDVRPVDPKDLKTERSVNVDKVKPETAPMWVSAAAGFGGLIVTGVRAGYSEFVFDYDPTFRHNELSADFFQKEGAGTEREVAYLAGAKRLEDWQYRSSQVVDQRYRDKAMADNPGSAMVGSLFDADIALGGVKAVRFGAAATTGQRAAERVAGGSLAAAATVGAYSYLGDDTLRTADEQFWDASTMFLARAVAPLSRGTQSTPTTKPGPDVKQGEVTQASSSEVLDDPFPNASGTGWDRTGHEDAIKSLLRVGEEATPDNWQELATARKQGQPRAKELLQEVNAPLTTGTVVRGTHGFQHGSQVSDVKFTDTWDGVTGKSYHDNVFGDDVVYLAEEGQWWIQPTEEAAAKYRMPYYPNVHNVEATFEKAFVLTPENVYELTTLLEGKTLSGPALVAKLRQDGYDGLIIRGFDENPRDVAAFSGISEDLLQNQTVAFNPKALKVVEEVGETTLEAIPLTPPKHDLGLPKLAQEIDQELQELKPPTGTPTQQISKHPIISKLQSVADELRYYTKGDTTTVVNKLYSNPAINNGDDVVSAQNAYWNNYNHRLSGFTETLKEAVATTGVRNSVKNRVNGKYAAATKQVSGDFQAALQRVDSDVERIYKAEGTVPNDATIKLMIDATTEPAHIKKLMHSYVDSGIAVKVYDDVRTTKLMVTETKDPVTGELIITDVMDNITRRPTYLTLRHSHDKIMDTVHTRKLATMDEVADFVGAQIAKAYPDLLKPKGPGVIKRFVLTERQIGKHFLQTQKASGKNQGAVMSIGMDREAIADLLTRTGQLTEKEAVMAAEDIYKAQHMSGTSTPKHMRTRIDWNWDASMITSVGHRLSMRDLVDDNVLMNLQDYSRSMAYRNGLADYGLKSETDLRRLLESYTEKLPEGTDVGQVRQFMENTIDTLMGRAIENNPVPLALRSAQAVADLFLLANSMLYGMIDLASQMQKVGVLRSLPAMRQGMKAVFNNMQKFNITEAKELEDILTGRLIVGSQWQNFSTRYADNFAVGSGIHDAAQYVGQAARFLNLSESLKRFQVGTLASVYANNLKKAMKGDVKELDFMKNKLKLNETLIREIQGEYAKHGTNIDAWANGTRLKYEQKVFHDADNLAMNVHRGEVPAVLEHSAVGRIIFPYMKYAAGMQNKVLRRTINRDGAAGLAMLMAVQIPTAMLVGAAINIRTGKDPDEDLALMTVKAMSALGSLNYPLEIAMAGLDGGGVTALAPIGKTYKFGASLFADEFSPSQTLRNSPINAAMPLHYLMLALEE